MEKKECIYLFEQYISGKASDEEIERLRTYFENDPALNTWFDNRILSSSDCIDDRLKVKMFANICSQIQDNKEIVCNQLFNKLKRVFNTIFTHTKL